MSTGAHLGRRVRRIPYKRESDLDASPPQGGINVTPLVDVCLVLLIIFMVVTPMLGRGKDVRLPVLVEANEHKEGDQVFISVDDTGVYIDQDLYTSRGDFAEALETAIKEAEGKAKASNYQGPLLFLKGDRETTYGRVRIVMEWVKGTETLQNIALVVDRGS